jgi:hypothetical protein
VTTSSGKVLYAISDANTPSTNYPYGEAVGDANATGSSGFTYNINGNVYTAATKALFGVNDSGRWVGTSSYSGSGAWLEANGTTIGTSSNAYWFQSMDSTGTYIAGENQADTPGYPLIYKLNSAGAIASTPLNTSSGSTYVGAINAVNSSGWGVGGEEKPSLSQTAFVWTGGALEDINTTNFPNLIGEGGATPNTITFRCATGIDDRGDMLVWGLPYVGATYCDTYFLSVTPLVATVAHNPGDVNCDGRVDINDLTIVLNNYDQTGMAWTQGCMDGDPTGAVDINDLTIVLDNYGTTYSSAGVMKAVPEPCTLALLAVGLVGLLAYAWRRRV